MNIDVFGVWADRTSEAYTVIGGWTLEPPMLVIALTRLLFPFFCGLLLSRLFTGFDGGKKLLNADRFNVKGGFWICLAAVAILLAMPRIGGTDPHNFWMNGLYEMIVILICFPLIVLFGVGSKDTHLLRVFRVGQDRIFRPTTEAMNIVIKSGRHDGWRIIIFHYICRQREWHRYWIQ